MINGYAFIRNVISAVAVAAVAGALAQGAPSAEAVAKNELKQAISGKIETLAQNSKISFDRIPSNVKSAAMFALTTIPRPNQFPTSWTPITVTSSMVAKTAQQLADDLEGEVQSNLTTRLDDCLSGSADGSGEVAQALIIRELGQQAYNKYATAKQKICTILPIVAKLYALDQQYENLKNNGYQIFGMYKKQRISHKPSTHRYVRHIEMQSSLTLYIDNPQALQLDTMVTLAGDPWHQTQVIKNISALAKGGSSPTNGHCWQAIPHLGVCMSMSNITSNSAEIHFSAWGRVATETKEVSLGSYTFSAPFGYINQLNTMKQNGMTNLKNRLTAEMSSLLGIDSQTTLLLEDLALIVQSEG